MRRFNTNFKIVLVVGMLLLGAAAPSSARTAAGHNAQLSAQVDQDAIDWLKLLLEIFWSRYAMAAN